MVKENKMKNKLKKLLQSMRKHSKLIHTYIHTYIHGLRQKYIYNTREEETYLVSSFFIPSKRLEEVV